LYTFSSSRRPSSSWTSAPLQRSSSPSSLGSQSISSTFLDIYTSISQSTSSEKNHKPQGSSSNTTLLSGTTNEVNGVKLQTTSSVVVSDITVLTVSSTSSRKKGKKPTKVHHNNTAECTTVTGNAPPYITEAPPDYICKGCPNWPPQQIPNNTCYEKACTGVAFGWQWTPCTV
jgi:hypothetical protein